MTYIMRADRSRFQHELMAAAERGVRVRLLLDDLNTGGLDQALRAMDAHPNLEVRLFNPARNRAGGLRRALEMGLRFAGFNRRMHNKAWIADNRLAIVGGRNVGDEYFGQDRAMHFADLDLLVQGAAVAPLSAGFDLYWNDRLAVPYQRLKPRSGRAGAFAAVRDAPGDIGPLPEPATRRLAAGRAQAFSGKAEFITDTPAKLSQPDAAPQ